MNGHPRGLFVLAATELAERFSYYGMTSLLALYMVKQLLLSDVKDSIGIVAFSQEQQNAIEDAIASLAAADRAFEA